MTASAASADAPAQQQQQQQQQQPSKRSQALGNLSKEGLVSLVTEQNDKLKELLTHFRQLQDDNVALREQLSLPRCHNHARVADLVGQSAELVGAVGGAGEGLSDRLRQNTRDRGVALAPMDTVMALKAENARLQAQLERGATHAAADTAEVTLLRDHVKSLERKVRELRQGVHDAEVRARAKEAGAGDDAKGGGGGGGNAAPAPAAPAPPAASSGKAAAAAADTRLSPQQLANVAASIAGGPQSPTSGGGGDGKKLSLNMEGCLLKQGGGWGPFKSHFKERYFELRGAQGALYYSAKKGGEQVGEIQLEQTTCAEAAIKPFSFCLFGPKLSRTYVMGAANQKERQAWMDAITHAADHYTKFIRGELNEKDRGEPQSFINSVVDCANDAKCVYTAPGQAKRKDISLQDFELIVVVGVGSFGKVLKVRHKLDGRIYAMKVLQKEMIVKHRMVPHTKAEKCILEVSDHPFVVTMHYAFQTRRQLVFILDFLTGGELFYHLVNEQRFPEPRAKFYAVEIALALEHLHAKNIIYRDLKPENLVLDGDGHVCLTDFGLAKTEV